MKKNLILISLAVLMLFATGCSLFGPSEAEREQQVYQDTLSITKEYAVLRYQTDNVLVNAAGFADYDAWNGEMSTVIAGWQKLENDSATLEKQAGKLSDSNLSFNLIEKSYAYTTEEINNVLSTTSIKNQISTLSNYLGVDAKQAQLILNETQNQVSREAYGAEGDVFEKCEQNSMRIKNGCKVTVFVGGAILSGGTSTLAQTAMVVGGADLALEVADDEARIALGDKNKVSEFVGQLRTVTEPAASILTLVNIPGNISSAIDKIGAVSFGADQVRSLVQDEKILGVSIKTTENGELKTELSGITEAELPEWMAANNVAKSGETAEEILGVTPTEAGGESETTTNQPPETVTNSTTSVQTMAGNYSGSGTLQHIEEGVESPDSLPVTLQLNEGGSGTVNVNGFDGDASYAGNNVSFSVTMKEAGAVVNCAFDGKATGNGSQVVSNGDMHFSMMGVTFASYSVSVQK